MSHFAQVAVAVGALLPILIGVIKQSGWTARTQSVVAFAACAVAALITAWIEGNINVHDLAAAFAYVYGAAIVTYHGLWKPTGADHAVTTRTDVGKGT
jgi:VIT1/CCC1 family predicted Fe2+/Mn2+ transporter